MSDIIDTIAFVGLSVLSLAALGWVAIPKAERGAAREVPARDWVAIVTSISQAEPCTNGPRN